MAPTYGALPDYAELQCASNFSFLHGASHAEDLAARAAQLGYAALAITDECSLAGVVRAHVEAKKAGLPFIVGSHFHLTNADGTPALSFTALAMTREGYGNLSELITLGRMRAHKGSYRIAPWISCTPRSPSGTCGDCRTASRSCHRTIPPMKTDWIRRSSGSPRPSAIVHGSH